FVLLCCFFFSSRRRHTRFSRDWSSTCALPISVLKGKKVNKTILQNLYEQALLLKRINEQIINIRKSETGEFLLNVKEGNIAQYEIGRASCRERVEISGVDER